MNKKWIELKAQDGDRIIIRKDTILVVNEYSDGDKCTSIVTTESGIYEVSNSFEEIVKQL